MSKRDRHKANVLRKEMRRTRELIERGEGAAAENTQRESRHAARNEEIEIGPRGRIVRDWEDR